MSHIILVHGTWATKAKWTEAGSKLRTAICKQCDLPDDDSTFSRVDWSGDNYSLSRRKASDQIEKSIRSRAGSAFLIGHSHGGSAIAYLLKDKPNIRQEIAGVVYMATPFISLRGRSETKSLLATIIAVGGLIGFVLLGVCVSLLNQRYGWSEILDGALVPFVLWGASIVTVVVVAWFWARAARFDYGDRVVARVERLAREHDTGLVPDGDSALFIRLTGDEAAAALSSSQFLGWAVNKLGNIVGIPVLGLQTLATKLFQRLWGRFIVVLGVAAIYLWLLLYVELVQSWSGTFFSPWKVLRDSKVDFLIWHGPVADFLSDVIIGVSYIVIFFYVLLILALAVWLLVAALRWLICTAALWSYGIWAPGETLFLDFAVEPVPYGDRALHHVSWHGGPVHEGELNHSYIYSNEKSVEQIAAWINGKLHTA